MTQSSSAEIASGDEMFEADVAPTAEPDATGGERIGAASAPGKIILLGEHAVVYGTPAIAVPMMSVQASAIVWQSEDPLEIRYHLPGDGRTEARSVALAGAPVDHPLAAAVRATLDHAGVDPATPPSWTIVIDSEVPVGAGLGSSAAVAVALVRAVADALDVELADEDAARLAYVAEACTHGTPSGIDNTVVALGRPIRFQAGEAEPLDVGAPLTLVVGDTGRHGATSDMVAGVARRRHERPRTYETWFADIARFVDQASGALASGENVRVGWLLDRNHLILQAMRVSTSELDALVAGARRAGALGAKMTGAGGGGVVIAVVTPEIADEVAEAMRLGGAVRTWRTTVPPTDALGRRQSDDRGGP